MRRFLLLGLLALLPATGASAAEPCPVVSTEETIASDTPGISLYMRRKVAPCQASPQRVLLYVLGATYPSETAFDLTLDGQSWMDFIARAGWDVWLVDLRGYGRSSRPAEMDRPAAENPPIVDTEVAVRDVTAAAAHVRARTGAQRTSLLGWSWGTAIMGTFASRHPQLVDRLVLYAPVWLRTTPSPLAGTDPLPAWRTVSREGARKRWLAGVPENQQAELIPPGWFEAWADATWATDPTAATTGLLRAPNGVLQDVRRYWLSDRPSYDPSAIAAPTLLVVGDWDQDTPPYMAQALFGKLSSTPWKRLVMVSGATHTLIMERHRMQLFREVQLFLDEPAPGTGR